MPKVATATGTENLDLVSSRLLLLLMCLIVLPFDDPKMKSLTPLRRRRRWPSSATKGPEGKSTVSPRRGLDHFLRIHPRSTKTAGEFSSAVLSPFGPSSGSFVSPPSHHANLGIPPLLLSQHVFRGRVHLIHLIFPRELYICIHQASVDLAQEKRRHRDGTRGVLLRVHDSENPGTWG